MRFDYKSQDYDFNDITMPYKTSEYSELDAVLTDDFFTRVQSINDFTNLLVDSIGGKLNEEEKCYVALIQNNILRLKKMKKALITLSKVKNNIFPKQPTNIREIIESAVDRIDLINYQTAPKIIIQMPKTEAMYVYVEPQMFEVLLYQVIDNACKYGSPNGIQQVHIKVFYEKPQTIFEIRDNGIGIDSNFFKLIFNIFCRLDNDKNKDENIGAGLSIAKKIVDYHQGKIWIKSNLDKGTNILFSIPDKENQLPVTDI